MLPVRQVLVFLSKASRAAAVDAATKCLRQKKRDLDAKQKAAAQATAAADSSSSSSSPSSPTKQAPALTLTARESLDACRACAFAEEDADEFDPVPFFVALPVVQRQLREWPHSHFPVFSHLFMNSSHLQRRATVIKVIQPLFHGATPPVDYALTWRYHVKFAHSHAADDAAEYKVFRFK